MQGSKKALMFLTASRWERRRHGDVPVESSVLFHQCEAMKRKAEQLDADIIEKFAIPKQSDLLAHPLFRGMLQVISNQGIDYVLIYPNRPHRNRERSAVITAAINRAGAQVVSSQNVQNVTVLPEHLYEILAWLNDTNTTQRRDAQLRRQWERKKRTSQAA
jgi:hypothetical protein